MCPLVNVVVEAKNESVQTANKETKNYLRDDLQIFCTCLYVHKNSCKVSNRSKINSRRCCADTILLDFSLTVKAATLIFISGCGSAIPSAKEGKSGFIYNLVKS